MKRLLKFTGIFSVVLTAPLLLSGFVFGQNPTANQAKFCQNANYGGQCFTVSKGAANFDLAKKAFPGGGNWNDTISSMKVGANVRVRAFSNSNLTRDCILFSGSSVGGMSGGLYSNLSSYTAISGGSWNDRISSYQVGGAELKCP